MSGERKPIEQRGFGGLKRLTGATREGDSQGPFDAFVERFRRDESDWLKDAEYSLAETREPGARGLLYVIACVVLLLLVWAANAPIDEVTRGEGKVIPASRLQVVQSSDGGVIRQLHVGEGDQVQKGDLLLRIDPTRYNSSFRETEVRIFALQAKVERLKALINGEHWQPDTSKQLSAEQLSVLNQEQAYFIESREEYSQTLAVAKERYAQQKQAVEQARARERAARQSARLSAQELEVTRPLLEAGAISEVEILRLERDLAAASGELEQASAEVERSQAAVQEAQARIAEARHSARNRWRSELSSASSELNSLQEGSVALEDRVQSATLRSPVAGTVQRVLFNTPGAVVGQGEAVVEIVPADDRLLIEAKIAPQDIAFLRPGLPATIKLHAYDFAVYGGIPAEVHQISADTITDERDNTYYLVQAITDKQAISEELKVIPGMTATLDIITGERTVLSYLLKPLLRAKANSLGER